MGISLQLALIGCLVCLWVYQIRAFSSQIARLEAQIDEFRLREQKLIDKLLTKNGFAPLLEREEVLKIPDPEIRQPNFIEEAFYADSIMEEIEHEHKSLIGLTREEMQAKYPHLWEAAKQRIDALQQPLLKR